MPRCLPSRGERRRLIRPEWSWDWTLAFESNLDFPSKTSATKSDELFMEEALRAAQRAFDAGEVPVGAVVVFEGDIIGWGSNRNITDSDPTAHAEMVALREAGAAIGNHRLEGCELFATIEPCAMCAGALVHARLKRLIYGADDAKAGAVSSVMQVLNHPNLNHQMEVRSGVLAGRCAELLQEFFRVRRKEKSSLVSSQLSETDEFTDE
jgi:tRNA(adenine34) deaminase